jgi:hypothetical protein
MLARRHASLYLMVENPANPSANDEAKTAPDSEPTRERVDRGLSDLVKRAMSAGLEVASRSKDDFVRVATTEMRAWLDRLDLQSELARALTKMVVEVKAEVRFRPRDDGKLEPEAKSEIKINPTTKT